MACESICHPTFGSGRPFIEIPQTLIHNTQQLSINDIAALKTDELQLRSYTEDIMLPQARIPRSIETNLNDDQSQAARETKHYRSSFPVFAPTRPWFTPPIYYTMYHY